MNVWIISNLIVNCLYENVKFKLNYIQRLLSLPALKLSPNIVFTPRAIPTQLLIVLAQYRLAEHDKREIFLTNFHRSQFTDKGTW